MEFIAKLIIASLIYFVITSVASYIRKKSQEARLHRKKQDAETEAKKESNSQTPVA
jgi:hypothetical protein